MRGGGWPVVLVAAVILPVLYVSFGSPKTYYEFLAPLFGLDGHYLGEVHGRLFQFLSVFFLFFVVPTLIWRFGLNKSLGEMGMAIGDFKFGLFTALLALLVLVPVLYAIAGSQGFQSEYPLAKRATEGSGLFALYEASLLLYYVGWEAFFRGFILFGAAKSYGPFAAIVFETSPSVLLHIGKPLGELWASVVAGFLFGWWALRARSFLYVLALHYTVGVLNDIFCAFRGGLLG